MNSNEYSYLIVPPIWRQRRISPQEAFGAEVRRLLERYLHDRYFLQINPRTRIEQITIDLAEDLEDKENIKRSPDETQFPIIVVYNFFPSTYFFVNL